MTWPSGHLETVVLLRRHVYHWYTEHPHLGAVRDRQLLTNSQHQDLAQYLTTRMPPTTCWAIRQLPLTSRFKAGLWEISLPSQDSSDVHIYPLGTRPPTISPKLPRTSTHTVFDRLNDESLEW